MRLLMRLTYGFVFSTFLLNFLTLTNSHTLAFAQTGASKQGLVFFNQKFVEGLYADINLDEPDQVFELIFSNLAESVTVYPTENYFYWYFHARGKTIWGNFRLDVLDRDQGVIHLGYFEYDENGNFQDREGNDKAYSAKHGVIVKKLNRFAYSVSYKDKTVVFKLNDIGMEPPQKAKLMKDETYVGPVFDESGLKFFLIFNNTQNHFYYVLNEDGFTPDSFNSLDDHIVIGKRTAFAFYLDKANNRKILIAVNGRHTDRNHYYDGPFDQLPDNYVEETDIKKYMELAYPYTRDNIDKYGMYLDDPGARVIINSYQIYYYEDELDFVATCQQEDLAVAEFFSCITPDPNQEPE